MFRRLPHSTLFPYTTLFRSEEDLGFCPSNDLKQGLTRFIAHVQRQAPAASRTTPNGPRLAHKPPYFFERRQQSLPTRSEEHTSELQSHSDLVCRLLLEKKKN